MIQRRIPLRRKRPTKRRQAARCTVLRCARRPYRPGLSLCGTHLMARIDAEARRRVFERDERCQDDREHECRGPLQWAHLIGRGYRGVRHMQDNGAVLCAGAHTYYTTRPLEWQDWCLRRLGAERWAELEQIALEFASGRARLDLVETARAMGVVATWPARTRPDKEGG